MSAASLGAALRAWLRPSGLVFVGVCFAAWFLPLLDVLGFEYSLLVGALVSTVGALRVLYRLRGGGRSLPGGCRWELAARAARDLAGLVLIAALVSVANMLRVRNCEPLLGLAYLVVFGLGAVPMAVATALVAAHLRTLRRAVALVVVLLLASVGATLCTLALQPAIVAYDTYFGYYAGSIYDESLVGFVTHLAYRARSLVWAVLTVAACELARRPRRRDMALVVVGLVAALGFQAFEGRLGLERDRAYVERALGGHVQSEHFDIYYEARAFDVRQLELLVSDHEARYAELADFWHREPAHRLRSYVYGSRRSKGDLMGGYSTLVAKIWLGEMHITWDGVGDELLAHEMAHLFVRDDGYGPLKLSSRGGLVPIMALVEGAATAAAWGAQELDYHRWSAAIYRLELGEDISELLGPAGFWGRYSRRAYTLTGSFARWLIDEFGPERFRAAYSRGDFAAAYGRELDDLVGEWRAFLDAIPLDARQLEVARYRYDRPSLFGRLCARSIATRFERGDALVAAGEREAARRCFDGILADDPNNVAYRLRIADRWLDLREWDLAREQAGWVADADGAGRSSRARAREMLADIEWRAGADAEALAIYEDLLAAAGTEGDLRRLQAKRAAVALRDRAPRTEHAVREYLAAGSDAPGTTTVAELLVAFAAEGVPLTGYLAALRVAASGPTPAVTELAARVRAADRSAPSEPSVGTDAPADTPELAHASLTDAQRRRLAEVVAMNHALLGEARAACDAWAAVADAAPPGSEQAATAGMWLGRCRRGTLPPPPRATPPGVEAR